MKPTLLLATLLGALSLPGAVIYQQDFEAGGPLPAGWTVAGAIQTTGGLSAFGFGANHLRNDGQVHSVLTLTGLAAHTTLTLSFDLALWDSVDLDSDVLTLKADGVDLISAFIPIGNYFPVDNLGVGPGTLLTPAFTDFFSPNFGYGGHRDSARRISSITFSHTASSAVFAFAFPNSQGGTDESFGIDNIVVESNAAAAESAGIPEPSTFVLAAGALVTLLTLRRKK